MPVSAEYCKSTPKSKMGFSQISTCKARGYLARTSKVNKGKYIVSPKYKSRSKSRSRQKSRSKSRSRQKSRSKK
jgi:hypothetical protein